MTKQWLTSHRFGLLLLAAIWLIFFSRTLFLQEIYFLDDLKAIFYPLEHVYAAAQASGELPEWSNYFGFGHPLIHWGQLGFFTPLHLLFRFLGLTPLLLLQASILTYFALGLLGMYLFLKSLRLPPLACSLGAALFAFSGFNVGHLNHVNFYTGTMLLPWLLLCLNLFLHKPTLLKTASLTLLASAIALSSQPQVTLYTLIIASLYGLLKFSIRPTWKKAWLTLLAALLFFGLSSFSIFPLQEFMPLTERASGVDPAELYEFSYPPWHLVTLFLPYFYGDHANYFGAKGFQELAAFTGLIPLLLAGLALTSWLQHKTEKIFAILLISIAILFAPGAYSPLYVWLVENHWLRSLANPGRFVYFFNVGIALLAALGLVDLLSLKNFRQRLLGLGGVLVISSLVTLPLAWRFTQSSLERELWQRLVSEKPLVIIILLLSAALVPISIFISQRWSARLATLLTLTSFIALIFYAWNYNPLTTYQVANSEHLSPTGDYPRLYSRQRLEPWSQKLAAERPPAADPDLLILERHLNVTEQVSSARWIGALSLRPYREFIEIFFANDKDELVDGDGNNVVLQHRSLLNMAGVTHLAQYINPNLPDSLAANGFVPEQDIPVNESTVARLYRNPETFPKAFLASTAHFNPVDDETRAAMLKPDFDPAQLVYINGDTPPPPASLIPRHNTGTIEVINYQNTKVEIKVNALEPTWMVLTDSTTPNWHTLIDNQPAPAYRANTLFKAAHVPVGEHQVTFYYHSPAIAQAKRLTLLSLTGTLLLILFSQETRLLFRRLSSQINPGKFFA
jgi:hypothetical protein